MGGILGRQLGTGNPIGDMFSRGGGSICFCGKQLAYSTIFRFSLQNSNLFLRFLQRFARTLQITVKRSCLIQFEIASFQHPYRPMQTRNVHNTTQQHFQQFPHQMPISLVRFAHQQLTIQGLDKNNICWRAIQKLTVINL